MGLISLWLDQPRAQAALKRQKEPSKKGFKPAKEKVKAVELDQPQALEKESKEENKVESATMPDDTQYFTLDGEPPNGAVPPDRLLVNVPQGTEDPPNCGVPTDGALPQNQALESAGSPWIAWAPCGALQRPPFAPALFSGLLGYRQDTVMGPPPQPNNARPPSIVVHNHVHHYTNIHPPEVERTYIYDRTVPPDDCAYRERTWIKFWRYGIRPCEAPPYSYLDNGALVESQTFPRGMTLEAFLTAMGVPHERGYGVQLVALRARDGVWQAGKVFEWGVGDCERPLRSLELGWGLPGNEVWLCAWSRQ